VFPEEFSLGVLLGVRIKETKYHIR